MNTDAEKAGHELHELTLISGNDESDRTDRMSALPRPNPCLSVSIRG
jgi:hypothetical protein